MHLCTLQDCWCSEMMGMLRVDCQELITQQTFALILLFFFWCFLYLFLCILIVIRRGVCKVGLFIAFDFSVGNSVEEGN